MKIYFAFPDRAYHYDCAQCDALCCRGHGIGTAARETPALLAHYPELAHAATSSGARGANFSNPAGGCFFLTEANLCRVEQEHGRGAKPGVCVQFPFNDYSRLGHVIVVRPHFLCPLRLLPGAGSGRHAEIEKSIHDTGTDARAAAQPGRDLSPEQALAIVAREEKFRDKCGAAIGSGSFDRLIESESNDREGFLHWRERALRLWGLPSLLPPRDDFDDILLALASPLRVRAFFLAERTRLRILSLAAAYVRSFRRISSAPATLQSSHHMIVNVFGVLRFFAYGNVAIRLKTDPVNQGADFQNPLLTLAFYQAIEELQAGGRLFDVLERALPTGVSGLERAIFFHQLACRVRELRRA